jgi:hypothetical protein
MVLVVDLVFMVIFFLANLRTASAPAKLAFTVLWTLATVGVVLRGLTRLRRARVQSPASGH